VSTSTVTLRAKGASGVQVLWVFGAPGVGKSTAAWQLYSDFASTGVVCAYVDIDQIGMCFPAPALDSDRHRLKGRALAAIVPNYTHAGAEVLVVSGVLDPTLTDWYRDELRGAGVTFCGLSLDDAALRRRHEQRGTAPEDWDSVRRNARDLDDAQSEHPTVDTTGLTPQQVADAVRGRVASTGLLASRTPSGTTAANQALFVSPVGSGAGRVMWLYGSTAVGKSTVAWAVFTRLLQDGTKTAYLDLQQLGFFGGPDGASHHALQAANVAALWGCFHADGATHLVLSGSAETVDQVQLYRELLPTATLTMHRLRASHEELAGRVQARGRGEGPRLAGDRLVGQPGEVLQNAVLQSREEQQRLDDRPIGDVVLDTTAADVGDLATEVLRPAVPPSL
jgi:adenylylsulfate kinase-like enzyme